MTHNRYRSPWSFRVTEKTDGLLVSYGALTCGYMRFYEAWLYRLNGRIPNRMMRYVKRRAKRSID